MTIPAVGKYTIDRIFKSDKGFMAVSKEQSCGSPTATYMKTDGSYSFAGKDFYNADWEEVDMKNLPEKALQTLRRLGWK